MTKFRMSTLSALVAVGVMGMAGVASAAVVGGGATLPEDLYNGDPQGTGILTSSVPGFAAYTGVGSGAGKRAFFNNDSTEFGETDGRNVDYAGSDSLVTTGELGAYNNPNNADGRSSYGSLIQVPSVLTSVTVPFNVPELPTLSLTSKQLTQIFAGQITNWNQLGLANAPDADIRVVYREDESGTTEIFIRHLDAIDEKEGLNLVSGVDKDFTKSITVNNNYIAAPGSDGVVSTVNATAYSIGYVSPDKIEANFEVEADLASKVAYINGALPSEVDVQAAVEDVPVPVGGQLANPLAWGISNPNPSAGYPIVASTNLLFSQCYADSADENKIRKFFENHYDVNYTLNDQKIQDGGFVKLPDAWLDAVHDAFWASNSGLSIGNTSICNGIGRPQ